MIDLYLAAPYTHPDAIIRAERAEFASIAAAHFAQQGTVVFSPITHGHALAQHMPAEKACHKDFWMASCIPFLRASRALAVLPLAGWQTSTGIAEEISLAKRLGRPVYLIASPELEGMLEPVRMDNPLTMTFDGVWL